MRAKAIFVAHREPMLAQALADALDRFSHLVTVGVTSRHDRTELPCGRIDAAVIDSWLAGAPELAKTLRRRGTRVVFLGDGSARDEGIWVAPTDSVESLAAAMVPGVALRKGTDPLPLTAREGEVLSLAARGFPAKSIAHQLGISSKTVEAHKTRAFRRLGVPNQAAAVSLFTASEAVRAPGMVVGTA